jgi:hypothetical protein
MGQFTVDALTANSEKNPEELRNFLRILFLSHVDPGSFCPAKVPAPATESQT